MSRCDEARHTRLGHGGRRSSRARWPGARGALLLGVLAAGLVLGPVLAAAADEATPSSPQQGDLRKRVSPYARFAREQRQRAERGSVRVKPSSFSVGRAPRVSGRAQR